MQLGIICIYGRWSSLTSVTQRSRFQTPHQHAAGAYSGRPAASRLQSLAGPLQAVDAPVRRVAISDCDPDQLQRLACANAVGFTPCELIPTAGQRALSAQALGAR